MKFSFLLIFLLGALIFISCGDDDDNPVAPVESQILISPSRLAITDRDTAVFFISLQPASSHNWKVTSKPAWLNLSQNEGVVTGKIIELRATINKEILQSGNHSGRFSIMTDGAGICEAEVDVYIAQYPDPIFEPKSLHFSGTEYSKSITIINQGQGPLNGALYCSADWIVLNDRYISVYPKNLEYVTISVNRDNLPIGTLETEVILYYNNYLDSLTLDVSADVEPTKAISASVDTLFFGTDDMSKNFDLINVGNIDFEWSLSNSHSELTCTPTSGNIAVGASTNIEVKIDRSDLLIGENFFTLLIKNSDGNTVKTIPVKVQHFKETKWLISGNVIDAEFSKSLNRLVIVTSEPNELRVCNTADNTMRTLALNKTPKCISISPDGKKAAVGYDGAMSYIDLNSVSEISYNTVAANAFDIVLTDNSWVYVTPWEDQWCNISCYNLQTGQETLSQGTLYERTNIKLHPSGKYLYTAENGLSPSDIEKYDIQNGTAKYLYDSPYHGDYPFSGNLWFMEDGTRLISRGKTVLKLSENKDSDLRYAGSINADGQIISLDHRASINKICAIMSQSYNYDPKPSNKISFFEATYLNFEKSITLPDFSVPDGKGGQKFFKSNAKYCFFNSDGSNYIVIMQAEEGMPTLDTWAIYSKKL